jgi:hypothetical protein
MYWPIGTPRAYATCNNRARASILVSHDGLSNAAALAASSSDSAMHSHLPSLRSPVVRADETDLMTPITPATPATPTVQSVEHDEMDGSNQAQGPFPSASHIETQAATKEPILAIQMSRTGHIFAVITSTTMTIWQTKVRLGSSSP